MSDFCSFSIALQEFMQSLRESKSLPIELPFPSMNKKMGGLREGEVTIIGGREGHGKSALAQQIVIEATKYFRQDEGKKRAALIFSLEMPKDLVIARIVAQENILPYEKLLNPILMTDADWLILKSAYEEIWDWPLVVDERTILFTKDIREEIETIKEEYEPKLILVDYLQLLSDGIGLNESNRLDDIARHLKEVARLYKCHVIAISSLNRSFSDPSSGPSGMNIRGSGGINFAADNIWLLWRPGNSNRNLKDAWKNFALLTMEKVRNAPSGEYYLRWHGDKLMFSEATREEQALLDRDTDEISMQRKIF